METTTLQNAHPWGPILSTKPLSYKELIVRSLRLYFASFAAVISLSFLLSLLVFLPRLISYVIGYNLFGNISFRNPHLLWLALIDFLAVLALITIFWRLHCVAHYKHETYKEDLGVGVHKVIYVFIAVLIQGIIIFGAIGLTYLILYWLFANNLLFMKTPEISWSLIMTILLFFAQLMLILYLSTLFIFLLPLIAVENEHILTSIKRSVSLTWNHWWLVFSRQVSPWIYFAIFSLIIKFLVGVNIHIYFVPDQAPHHLGPTLLQIMLFSLFIIWPAALLYLQLKDLEIRKKLEIEHS